MSGINVCFSFHGHFAPQIQSDHLSDFCPSATFRTMTLETGFADTEQRDRTEAPRHSAGPGGQETNVADGFNGTESTEEFAPGSTFPTSCGSDLWRVRELLKKKKLFHLVGPAKGLSVIFQLKLAGAKRGGQLLSAGF